MAELDFTDIELESTGRSVSTRRLLESSAKVGKLPSTFGTFKIKARFYIFSIKCIF